MSSITDPGTFTEHDNASRPMEDVTQSLQYVSIKSTSGKSIQLPTSKTTTVVKPSDFKLHMSFLNGIIQNPTVHNQSFYQEEVRTSPIFSGPVLDFFGSKVLPQYGLLAQNLQVYHNYAPRLTMTDPFGHRDDPRIFLNVNTPWSAFICGSQGSGKSHTLSCMLENCLLPSPLGKLPCPLAAIVFHYDRFTSYAGSQICEAAYLCSSGIPVKVLVSPTNFWRMKAAYQNLPGLPSDAKKPEVVSLLFKEKHLDVSRMMNLMAVSEKDGPVPLYIEVILRILRQMAMESQGAPGLNYQAFRRRLALEGFSLAQSGPLKLRLDLLESFMEQPMTPGVGAASTARPSFPDTKKGRSAARAWEWQQEEERVVKEMASARAWSFDPGTLTIIDLSCPFVDDSAACALFTICLELFLENRGDGGRVVALDEAHKFMGATEAASRFTESLLQIIRQQRHLATRVIIATQEPTISPKLLDLSTMTIVHRFTSPDWFVALRGHLAGVSGLDGESKRDVMDILRTIVHLETGQALMFSPAAMLDLVRHEAENPVVEKLGMAYIKIAIRKRLSEDGGKSLMAV